MNELFDLTMEAIFPRKGDQANWLGKANDLLCGYTPKRAIELGLKDRVFEALQQLSNVIGGNSPSITNAHREWQANELALQAHRGPPKKGANSTCVYCGGSGVRIDELEHEDFYCSCMYENPAVLEAS